MKLSNSLTGILGSFLAIAVSHAWSTPQCPSSLYALSNDPQGASIVAMCVDASGTISGTVMTSTEGKGLAGRKGPGQPAVGSLFGSDSVVVSGNVTYDS